VLFVGDAAHQVSPFGARGANSGIQDADNLCWKLHAVVSGAAPERLLDTYDDERGRAADENLLNSTRSTDFITPKSAVSKLFRDAVLDLARTHPFARSLVNSGRLSVPTVLSGSPLGTPDADRFEGTMVPGAPMDDAPVTVDGARGWLLREVAGTGDAGFTLLVFGDVPLVLPPTRVPVTVRRIRAPGDACAAGDLVDVDGLIARRYDGHPGTVYLLRPDQHVAARWRGFDPGAVGAALDRALCAA
jgi:3-(3-hydroxy-phenyl)propionate hydroxylase